MKGVEQWDPKTGKTRLLEDLAVHDPLEVQDAAGRVVPDRAGRERTNQNEPDGGRDHESGHQQRGVDEPGVVKVLACGAAHPGIIRRPEGQSAGGASRRACPKGLLVDSDPRWRTSTR